MVHVDACMSAMPMLHAPMHSYACIYGAEHMFRAEHERAACLHLCGASVAWRGATCVHVCMSAYVHVCMHAYPPFIHITTGADAGACSLNTNQ